MDCIKHVRWSVSFVATLGVWVIGCEPQTKEVLGQQIFDDTALSANHNQACASCHSRDTGGTGELSQLNAHGAVYEGSIAGRFGDRKPPSSAYASVSPLFAYDTNQGFFGGNFWDGRATGWKLGNPAADQAQGPFLNPVEQALPSADELVSRVCGAEYGDLFRQVWGSTACDDTEQAYSNIALSVAAFEGSRETNQYSSKFDAVRLGKEKLNATEAKGLSLFNGKANCAQCHSLTDTGDGPLFTDFAYDNLGVPPNPENPFYDMDQVLLDGKPINPLGAAWVDPGLGGFLESLAANSSWRTLPYVTNSLLDLPNEELLSFAQENRGKHRVPTLRNVDKRPSADFVKAYGHNGYFKSLSSIVHFYNTRDALPVCPSVLTDVEAMANNCWPKAEVTDNINTTLLGDLHLTVAQEESLVAFLATLSDGWFEYEER